MVSIRQRNSPSVESCGYTTYFLSNVFAVLYALWVFMPDSIAQQIDKQYGIYYPPRQLAVYIPTYFVLLFFCIPIMYMGLNMLCAPNLDDVDAVWDTMSNEDLQVAESTKHIIDSQSNSENIGVAIPSICDLDVREVNHCIRQQLKKTD